MQHNTNRRNRFFLGSFHSIFRPVLSALLALCLTATAQAADFVVTNTADGGPGSLRDAINQANADAITFNVPASDPGCTAGVCTIILGDLLVVTDAAGLTLDGAGGKITLSGNNAVLVLFLDRGAALEVRNLTIANGTNTGPFAAGGIETNLFSTLTVSDSTFTGNSSGNAAGAIFVDSGTLTVSNSTFAATAEASPPPSSVVGGRRQRSAAAPSPEITPGTAMSCFC